MLEGQQLQMSLIQQPARGEGERGGRRGREGEVGDLSRARWTEVSLGGSGDIFPAEVIDVYQEPVAMGTDHVSHLLVVQSLVLL